jgi:hypothetical protein
MTHASCLVLGILFSIKIEHRILNQGERMKVRNVKSLNLGRLEADEHRRRSDAGEKQWSEPPLLQARESSL